jgi:hypothetical protein
MIKDINGIEIKVGSNVLWHDPDESAQDLSRVYEVYDIEDTGDDDSIIDIFDEYSEAQVFADELEVVGFSS